MRKRLLSLVLTLAMVASMVTVAGAVEASDFSDMPDNYATESLEAAVANGLLSGTGAGLLNPDGDLTRAQMAAILVRAFGGEETASLYDYTDVSTSAWYYSELACAVYMELFQGSGTTMNPDAAITRQEAFVVLARAFALEDGDTSILSDYADVSAVADWAAPQVAAMVATGYVQGAGNYLNPTSTITRQDFAVVMDRMVESYISVEGEYTELADGSVMINVPDVTLSDVTIDGNLIIGDGVGDGDITLNNVTVTGALIVRGGGENTVKMTGDCSIPSAVLAKVQGNVRLLADADVAMSTIDVRAGNGTITVEGVDVDHIQVGTSDVTVYARAATANSAHVSEPNSMIILSDGTTISTISTGSSATGSTVMLEEGTSAETVTMEGDESTLVLGEDASVDSATMEGNDSTLSLGENASISDVTTNGASTVVLVDDGASIDTLTATGDDTTIGVADGGSIDTVEAAGAGTTVSGDGTVGSVEVTGDNTTVETEGTDVNVSDTVEGTTADGESVAAGETVTTESSTTTTTTTTGSSSSGNSYTSYTVTFDANGGSDVSSQSIRSGYTISTSPETTHEGYTFLGWYDASGAEFVFGTTTVTAATTLTAKWGYSIDTAEKLTTALSTAVAGDVLAITADLGSTEAYTVYDVNAAVTITATSDVAVYGTFDLLTDGITVDGLTIYPEGSISQVPGRNGINIVAKTATVTDCIITMSENDAVLCNAIVIWPYGSAAASYEISGNTLNGFSGAVPNWSSSAMVVVENLSLTRFGTDFTSATSTTMGYTEEQEVAMVLANTINASTYNYVRQNWNIGSTQLLTVCGTNTYSKGTVYATDGTRQITSGANTATSLTHILAAYDEVYLNGDVELTANLTIAAGKTLTIEDDVTLTVPAEFTLTNNGTLIVEEGATLDVDGTLQINRYGELVNNGTIDNDGTITGNSTGNAAGTIENNGTLKTATINGIIMFAYYGGDINSYAGSTLEIEEIDPDDTNESGVIVGTSGLNVTSGYVTIGLAGTFNSVEELATNAGYAVTLTNGCAATIAGDFQDADNDGYRIAGKDVFTVESGATLTIDYRTEVSGELVVDAGGELIINADKEIYVFTAGDDSEYNGSVTINGTVNGDGAITGAGSGTITIGTGVTYGALTAGETYVWNNGAWTTAIHS